MRRPIRTAFALIVVLIAGLEGAYLIAANVFLNTDLAYRSINRKPDKFQIRWRSAWSLYPGMVVMRGAEMRGQSRRVEWYARVYSVTTGFEIRPLFDRTVRLSGTRAKGIVYRQKRKLLPGETSRTPPSDLPTIPARLEVPGGTAVAAGGPPKPRGKPWSVIADPMRCGIDELWFDRFRLVGPMRLETPMRLRVRGPMEFPKVRLGLSSGKLMAGRETIFDGLRLDVSATVHPFVPKSARRLGLFRFLSGRFDISSQAASLFFLDAYFHKTPWLHFNAAAPGRAVLLLDHGKLQPGTSLEVTNKQVDMVILDRHLTGDGVIQGIVEAAGGAPKSTLTARLHNFKIAPVGGLRPFARGRNALLVATSYSPDLANPFTDVAIVFDQPDAEILDLSFYNSLIPPSSKFRFLSGSGTLRYHLEGSQAERSLHGRIDLDIRQGSARFENFEMRGGFTLRTLLRQASPREMLFDISGTRLDVHAADPRWTASFVFPKARMRFSDPMSVDAFVRLEMMDTRPLVAMFDALKGVPTWLQRMMTIPDIKGSMAVTTRSNDVDLTDLDVTGKGLHALADLTLGRKSKEGVLYVRFHGFSLGIHLTGGGRDLKLIRPLRWFGIERAQRRQAAPGRR